MARFEPAHISDDGESQSGCSVLTPSTSTLAGSVAAPAAGTTSEHSSWKNFRKARNAAQEWCEYDYRLSPSQIGKDENLRNISTNQDGLEDSLKKFLKYNSRLPKCSQVPTGASAVLRVLGRPWQIKELQPGEPEVLTRGLGIKSYHDCRDELANVAPRMKQGCREVLQKVCSQTWLGADWPERYVPTSGNERLPEPTTSLWNIKAALDKKLATILDEDLGAEFKALDSRIQTLLEKIATSWADSLGLKMRMTRDLGLATCRRLSKEKWSSDAPTYSDEQRTLGSGEKPPGIPEAEKREPDLENDPRRLVDFFDRLAKDVDAELWDEDADSHSDPDTDMD